MGRRRPRAPLRRPHEGLVLEARELLQVPGGAPEHRVDKGQGARHHVRQQDLQQQEEVRVLEAGFGVRAGVSSGRQERQPDRCFGRTDRRLHCRRRGRAGCFRCEAFEEEF